MNYLTLSQEQINYIVRVTGIPVIRDAITYFGELMILEKIHPKSMPVLVDKMMARERKSLK